MTVASSNGADASVLQGERVEQLVAATGLNYTRFAMALAGLDPAGKLPGKGSGRWKRMESARRQLRRWRIGGMGLEPATARRLVTVANTVLEKQRRAVFDPEFLVEAEPPRATLERLDAKLELVLERLAAIEVRLG